jgi:hypothetical protein
MPSNPLLTVDHQAWIAFVDPDLGNLTGEVPRLAPAPTPVLETTRPILTTDETVSFRSVFFLLQANFGLE